jgi:hypothetical protein
MPIWYFLSTLSLKAGTFMKLLHLSRFASHKGHLMVVSSDMDLFGIDMFKL